MFSQQDEHLASFNDGFNASTSASRDRMLWQTILPVLDDLDPFKKRSHLNISDVSFAN